MTISTRNLTAAAELTLESLHGHFETQIREFDKELVQYLGRFQKPDAHYGMIRYHFGFADHELRPLDQTEFLPRGKRLRPILCMLFCRMMAIPPDIAKSIMMASEVMHCASLAHDDIEDRDSFRWGRPTINSLFGMDQAINLGDALIGLVYQILLELRTKDVEPAALLDVIEIFNRTHIRMCEGQHLDLKYKCYEDVEIEEYFDMIFRKTASPCLCIAETISVLASCSENTRRCLTRFGESLGVLYQICDDIRGIWCEPKKLGRPVGGDVCMQKAALPLIYGFKSGSKKFRALVAETSSNLQAMSLEKLNDIRNELAACGAEEMCFRDARRYYQQALNSLRNLNMGNPEIGVLQSIVRSCVASVGVAN